MRSTIGPILCMAALGALSFASDSTRIETRPDGTIRIARTIPEEFRNPWPADWEEAFWERANASLRACEIQPGKYGGTYFENEKASYPNAFIGFLKGQRKEAISFLEQEDDGPWSRKHTMGVDWFPAFTLRGQIRKYFFFGPALSPGYRQRMSASAKVWTEVDPLRRPNEFWLSPEQRAAKGMRGEGWTPEFHNSWVDVRGTDNLRAMRECAAFLMAEETGNAETARIYRERIRAYVTALYSTGMGEWDSANYLSHGLTAYLGLYDFAKDPEIRLLAKAHLDWTCTAAAVKYFRGSWAGPSIRDYGNVGPHAGAAGEFWFYFGDLREASTNPYRDFVHIITSEYRPPKAVVEMARKSFPRPVEILASKPSYDGWANPGGETKPTYFETTWIGEHTQMGSLPEGHRDTPGMNLNGFRLLAENSARGADTIFAFSSLDFNHGPSTATNGHDRIAQHRGNAIWLNAQPRAPIHLFLPKTAEIEEVDNRLLIRMERTWIALHLIRCRSRGMDAGATAKVCGPRKSGQSSRFPTDHVWTLEALSDDPAGFALEVAEPETHENFEAFKEASAVAARVSLPTKSEAHFISTRGETVGLRLTTEGMPEVFRNGEVHDWRKHWHLWNSTADAPVSLEWKSHILRVKAGGAEFRGEMRGGRYTFENR